MASNSNPLAGITEGLTNAFSLANMIHRQRIEDQSIALQQRQASDQEQEARSREERQNADLSMRLNAMGARQATPSDDLEADTGIATRFNTLRQPASTADDGNSVQGWAANGLAGLPQTETTVRPSFEPSDLKSRMIKAGGGKWILPSESEKDARTYRATKQESDAAVSKATAVETARGNAKIAVDASRLDKFGLSITDENAKLLGLKPGSKIQEEHVDDYNRALATAWARKEKEENNVVHAVPMYGDQGTGVAVVKKDGSVTWNPIDIGKKFTKPTATSPNEQRLADKAATDDLVNEAASRYARQYPKFEDADAALKIDAATDPFVGKQYLRIRKALPGASTADKPKTLNNMSADEALSQLQAFGGGQAKPKSAATPAPAATPQKTAAPAAKRPQAKNRKTGETLEWDGKAWVKAGA